MTPLKNRSWLPPYLLRPCNRHPRQHRPAIAHIAHGQNHMFLVALHILKSVHIEFAPGGGEAGGFNVTYCQLGFSVGKGRTFYQLWAVMREESLPGLGK